MEGLLKLLAVAIFTTGLALASGLSTMAQVKSGATEILNAVVHLAHSAR